MSDPVAFASTTAEDFRDMGVSFLPNGAIYRIVAPRGSDDLIDRLREEVERRVPSMSSLPEAIPQGYGVCDGCWDAMPSHKAGMCDLCCIARRKALGIQ